MKATKKELIDFANWLKYNTLGSLLAEPEYYVNRYLKSIISDEPDELQAVGKHEAEKEFYCPFCQQKMEKGIANNYVCTNDDCFLR